MNEIKEAKGLRWLAIQFPKVENPKDDIERMQNCINLYCTTAAEKIEQLTKEIESLNRELIATNKLVDRAVDIASGEMKLYLALHFGTHTDKDTVKVADVFSLIDKFTEDKGE